MSAARSDLPTGTVTFVFTDIQGSTRLVQELGQERFAQLLERHGRIVRTAFDTKGTLVRTEGDAFFYVFVSASDAVAAAAAAQRSLTAEAWPEDATIAVRMGLHTGEASLASADAGDDYVGFDVHRAARIASAGHGGQILVSEATRALARDQFGQTLGLRDLGEHRFKDLLRPEQVFQITGEGLPDDFAPIRSLNSTPNNLPVQMTSFIGRQEQVDQVVQHVRDNRLVTLTGPGGTGKTRLSLQAAAALTAEFPDGVYFVALAPVEDVDLVIPTVALEIGLQLGNQQTPAKELGEMLKSRRMLLVLDNFEQVVEAGSQLAEILRTAADVKILVSSRIALRVYGEQEAPIPPLQLPDPEHLPEPEQLAQFEAVRLFIERARAIKPDFAVDNENAPAVAGLCARLDGLPLAIELAAARIKVLSPQQIFDRLQKKMGALGRGARDLPARQQTLRGAIAWSYDLLDPDLQLAFRHLAVFAGSAALEDIETVCAGPDADLDLLDSVETLVQHSLLRQQEIDGQTRFLMLQTIREYASDRLTESGQNELLRDRHADCFLNHAIECAAHLMNQDRRKWLDRMEHDLENFRAATEWAADKPNVPTALQLVAKLWRFWQMRGHLAEAQIRCDRIVSLTGADDHPELLNAALEAAGGISYWMGHLDSAQQHYERALALSESKGDPSTIANAKYNLAFAFVLRIKPDFVRGRQLLDEALQAYEQLGDETGIARAIWGIGDLAFVMDDQPLARQMLSRCAESFRASGDEFNLGWSLFSWAGTELRAGNYAKSAKLAHESLGLFAAAGDQSGIVMLLDAIARAVGGLGKLEPAITLAAAAAAIRKTSGTGLAVLIEAVEGSVDVGDRKDDIILRQAADRGATMTVDQAVAFALQATELVAD